MEDDPLPWVSEDFKKAARTYTPKCCRMRCSTTITLCTYTDVPTWMARPHIYGGYRPDLNRWTSCASIFMAHNETGNIWTHLIATATCLCLAWSPFRHSSTFEIEIDTAMIPFGETVLRIYLLAATTSFIASTAYHVGNCCRDEGTCALLLRGDVSGIAILIAASFLPGVYFGFACFPQLQLLYILLVSILLLLGLGVSLLDCGSLQNHGDEPPFVDRATLARARSIVDRATLARIRTSTFVSFVCLGLVVALHWCIVVAPQARRRLFPQVAAMLGLYGIGFFFYSTRIPERWYPG